jgi:hypothetical protein
LLNKQVNYQTYVWLKKKSESYRQLQSAECLPGCTYGQRPYKFFNPRRNGTSARWLVQNKMTEDINECGIAGRGKRAVRWYPIISTAKRTRNVELTFKKSRSPQISTKGLFYLCGFTRAKHKSTRITEGKTADYMTGNRSRGWEEPSDG